MRRRLSTTDGTIVSLRPLSVQDEPFLEVLYVDRRAPELVPLGWTPPQERDFIARQFRAQQAGYASSFPRADHWLVAVDDDPAGRLLVDKRADEHRVVDLVILTPYRGRAIGTALMEDVIVDAEGDGVPVRLTVAAHEERLVGWYERLGFIVTERTGISLAMARPPAHPAGG